MRANAPAIALNSKIINHAFHENCCFRCSPGNMVDDLLSDIAVTPYRAYWKTKPNEAVTLFAVLS